MRNPYDYLMHHIPQRCSAMVLSAAVCALSACGNEPPAAPALPEADAVWQIQSSAHGITLAVGDTFQVSMTALNIDQQPMVIDSSAPYIYNSDDSSHVRVSSNGVITAIQPTDLYSPVHVIASLRRDNVFRVDTMNVAVTPTRQDVASIKLIAPDSARAGTFLPVFLNASAFDAQGNPLPDVYIWPSVKTLNALIDPLFYYVYALVPGRQVFYASATAYGKTFTDSLVFDFLNVASWQSDISTSPAGTWITNPVVDNQTVTIQPCGSFMWTNSSSDTLDLTFDNPSKVTACVAGDETGNALHVTPAISVTRKFPTVGEYSWKLARSRTPNVPVVSGIIATK